MGPLLGDEPRAAGQAGVGLPPVIGALVGVIAVVAAAAAGAGIFYETGPGPYQHVSVRGDTVTIFGRGLYRHMSAEVGPQGIAQDVVTMVVGVPLLLLSLVLARTGSVRGRFLLAGTLGYFFVTYLFYLMMGTYNAMFLGYVVLLGASFFALALTLFAFDASRLPDLFGPAAPVKRVGGFLIFTATAIALLWLGIVVPPLLSGAVIPPEVEHYTTLVVQGLDLALLLPLGVVSGVLLLRRRPLGYLLAPTYLVFPALLMTALTAKVVGMALLGYNVVPVVFIIPTLNLASIALAVLMLARVETAEG